MRKLWAIVALAVAVVSGCSANEDAPELTPMETVTPPSAQEPASEPESEPESELEPEPEPTTPAAETNERGNLPKEIGEDAGFTSMDGSEVMLQYRVTDLSLTTEPNELGEPPANGYFLIVSIEGETTAALTQDEMWWGWNAWDFTVLTEDGTIVNEPQTDEAYGAVSESEWLPDEVGPGQRFVGKIALDVPVEHGLLVYAPFGSTGHEFKF